MSAAKSVADWLIEKNMNLNQLVDACGLDKKVVEAIIEGRYTPSPQQRRKVSAALKVDMDQVSWGHSNSVEHMYGHGPQFGRTP